MCTLDLSSNDTVHPAGVLADTSVHRGVDLTVGPATGCNTGHHPGAILLLAAHGTTRVSLSHTHMDKLMYSKLSVVLSIYTKWSNSKIPISAVASVVTSLTYILAIINSCHTSAISITYNMFWVINSDMLTANFGLIHTCTIWKSCKCNSSEPLIWCVITTCRFLLHGSHHSISTPHPYVCTYLACTLGALVIAHTDVDVQDGVDQAHNGGLRPPPGALLVGEHRDVEFLQDGAGGLCIPGCEQNDRLGV